MYINYVKVRFHYTQEAVTTRNEGEVALDRARKTEAEHNNRLRNIQHQIQILRATEKHIAQVGWMGG